MQPKSLAGRTGRFPRRACRELHGRRGPPHRLLAEVRARYAAGDSWTRLPSRTGKPLRDGHQMIGRNGAPFTAISAATKPGRFCRRTGSFPEASMTLTGITMSLRSRARMRPMSWAELGKTTKIRLEKSPAFRFVRAGRVMARA